MTRAVERAPTRKEQQGAESRRRILDAAAALMAERGFAGTSISEVSRKSGLPASSIYWHFESKEGLLGAVMEEGAQRWFDELEREGGNQRGGPMGARTAAALSQHPEFLRFMFLIALERKHVDKASLGAIRRVRKLALVRLRESIRRLLESQGAHGQDELADQLALFALAVADGAFLQDHIDPRASDLVRTIELLDRALFALVHDAQLRKPG
ncbi:MAG TPA: helix-turn-helix domain-containing protein [Myxococcota bacterium]|nr:helix-turn-helix domain-containing protein [Myxococcota bacterium]